MDSAKNFTKITNEILKALITTKLTGQELQAILYIIRRTYGFHRTYTQIPTIQLANALGIAKHNATRLLKQLKNRNIISISKNTSQKANSIAIQNDCLLWLNPPSRVSHRIPSRVSNSIPSRVSPLIPNKENNKETLKESTLSSTSPQATDPYIEAQLKLISTSQPFLSFLVSNKHSDILISFDPSSSTLSIKGQ